jgi:maleate isomerase
MWQPDDWGWRARIGVLTPHGDIGPEAEFRAMAPEGVSVHAARVPLGAYAPGAARGKMDRVIGHDAVRSFAEPPLVDDATELLAAAPLYAVAFAFTSSSYVRSADDNAALKARLEARTRGIPVVVTCSAAVSALATLGASGSRWSIPLVFGRAGRAGCRLLLGQWFDVVHSGPSALPSDQRAIHPGQLYEWVRAHTPDTAEAVFIGSNGFRAVSVIQALEEDLGRPVLTANQVAFWAALRLSGARVPVVGYGRIFGLEPRAS